MTNPQDIESASDARAAVNAAIVALTLPQAYQLIDDLIAANPACPKDLRLRAGKLLPRGYVHSFEKVKLAKQTIDQQIADARREVATWPKGKLDDMHLWPETEAQLDERLGDSRSGWLKRADPATVAVPAARHPLQEDAHRVHEPGGMPARGRGVHQPES